MADVDAHDLARHAAPGSQRHPRVGAEDDLAGAAFAFGPAAADPDAHRSAFGLDVLDRQRRQFGRRDRGADGGTVDVVVVDVDRHQAVGLVVAAAVLVDALVRGPGGRRAGRDRACSAGRSSWRSRCGRAACSCCRSRGRGRRCPRSWSCRRRRRSRARAAGWSRRRGRSASPRWRSSSLCRPPCRSRSGCPGPMPIAIALFDRVAGGFDALRGRFARAQLGAAAASAGRRLQADVGRNQVPAGCRPVLPPT